MGHSKRIMVLANGFIVSEFHMRSNCWRSRRLSQSLLRIIKLRWFAVCCFYLFVLSIIVTVSCKPVARRTPPRPDSVPQDAFWSGGVDGGNWYKCDSAQAGPRLYWLTIYFDFDGRIRARGSFRLQEGVWIAPDSLVLDIRYYDGHLVGLADGRVLYPRNVVAPDTLE
jgi:hypothetical protein